MNLSGKKALIFGIANNRSIAYGIARSLKEAGADIAFTYQNERLLSRVQKVDNELNASFVVKCDVTDSTDLDLVFSEVEKKWGSVDIVVHSLAFTPTNCLENDFTKTSKEDFSQTMEISVFSLIDIANRSTPFMKDNGGSILTLSFYGSQKVMTGYKIMGPAKAALESSVKYLADELGAHKIRVNTLSPGPVKTLAASIFPNFKKTMEIVKERTPLGEPTTITDVGNFATYLCSDLAKNITGGTHYIDSGGHIMGA